MHTSTSRISAPFALLRAGILAVFLCSLQFASAAETAAAATTAQPSPAPTADQPSAILSAATDAFTQATALENVDPARARALYQSAALRYQQLLDAGFHNGKLFYNAGNAYYKLGETGKAILSYKEALRFMPNDSNLLGNLARARAQRVDKLTAAEDTSIPRVLFFWHYDLPLSLRAGMFAGLFTLFWTGMILRRIISGRARPRVWQLAVCGTLMTTFFLSLCLQPYEQARNREGVILQKEVIARKGNAETYQPAFQQPLHEGTEFIVCEVRPGWIEAQLPDGRRCWLPQTSVGLMGEC